MNLLREKKEVRLRHAQIFRSDRAGKVDERKTKLGNPALLKNMLWKYGIP